LLCCKLWQYIASSFLSPPPPPPNSVTCFLFQFRSRLVFTYVLSLVTVSCMC
jgi:hypothetical protein